ncbi:MAG: phosphoribosyltransferase [Planctomycetota bacterium]
MFANREDAGRQLAARFTGRVLTRPIVLAIPRGGVVTGAVLARELSADLDLIFCRKLRAAGQPELAIGAVCDDGQVWYNDDLAGVLPQTEEHFRSERHHQLGEIQRQKNTFGTGRPRGHVRGRTVIIADDGIATGATMFAALQSIRLQHPRELIVAVPVSSPDRLQDLRSFCDEVVCLLAPADFCSVSQVYEDFRQVDDAEVIRVLEQFESQRATENHPDFVNPDHEA